MSPCRAGDHGCPDLAQLGAAEACATRALVVAHLIAASGECRADRGKDLAWARCMVKDLAGLIDVYDQLTGRVAPGIATDDVRRLADSVA